MLISVRTTGCGLADMLDRIDLVYRLTLKYGHTFLFPYFKSYTHEVNYMDTLGLEAFYEADQWLGKEIVEIKLSDFPSGLMDYGDDVVVCIDYQHALKSEVFETQGLKFFLAFDYSKITKNFEQSQKTDYVLHLRLGDNYIYKISNDFFWNAGKRKFQLFDEQVDLEYKAQWSIEQVLGVHEALTKKGKSVKILCDGIDSGVKHLKVHKNDDYETYRDEALACLNAFQAKFHAEFQGTDYTFSNSDVLDDLKTIYNCKNLITAKSGFARAINKFFRAEKANVFDLDSTGFLKLEESVEKQKISEKYAPMKTKAVTRDFIGVTGSKLSMPLNFPLTFQENAGNMVHANAPFKLFKNCVHENDDLQRYGEKSFIDFLNSRCTHLILTLANILKPNDEDHQFYNRFSEFLVKVKIPVVVFGLGVRHSQEEGAVLNSSAVELLELMAEKSVLLGVRGNISKKIIERDAKVSNAYVTGCPSFYTEPQSLLALKNGTNKKRIAVALTNYRNEKEFSLLKKAISSNTFLIEPVNKFNHQYYLSCSSPDDLEATLPPPPYFLKDVVKNEGLELSFLKDFYLKNYRLFRGLDEWYAFNKEHVGFTLGTRFHVNMASVLSGVPALWVTHDDRTREMVDFFGFPGVSLEEIKDRSVNDLVKMIDYSNFDSRLPELFSDFNYYLSCNGLPVVSVN